MARYSQFDTDIKQTRVAFPGVPAAVIKAVIATESNFDKRAYLAEVNDDGSVGLMQIRLSTARGLGYGGTSENLFVPAINVYYGTAYLNQLAAQVQHPEGKEDWAAVISAYNGGWRPPLGFGARVPTTTKVCLRRDPATRKCLEYFTAKPGEFGNQPHVDRFLRWLSRFGGGRTTGILAAGVGFPLLLALGLALARGQK